MHHTRGGGGGGGGRIGVLRPFNTMKAIQSIILTHVSCIEERKERQNIGLGDTWPSAKATLVLLRARSTDPIHRTDILRPHPLDAGDNGVCIQ